MPKLSRPAISDKKIIQTYDQTKSSPKTAQKLQISPNRVYQVLSDHEINTGKKKRLAIHRKSDAWFQEQIQTKSVTSIARQNGVSQTVIRDILRNRKITKKRIFGTRTMELDIQGQHYQIKYDPHIGVGYAFVLRNDRYHYACTITSRKFKTSQIKQYIRKHTITGKQ